MFDGWKVLCKSENTPSSIQKCWTFNTKICFQKLLNKLSDVFTKWKNGFDSKSFVLLNESFALWLQHLMQKNLGKNINLLF